MRQVVLTVVALFLIACSGASKKPQAAVSEEPALLAGTVERVDLARETLFVRDARSGLVVTVFMAKAEHRDQPYRLADLHAGDDVSVRGTWTARGDLAGLRLEDIRRAP